MSRHRLIKDRGWANTNTLPKGPNGRCLCRWCGIEVPSGRLTFCSDECVHQHKIRSQPGYAKRQIEKRDKGICAACGLDTTKIKELIEQAIPTRMPKWTWEMGSDPEARRRYKEEESRRKRNNELQRRFRKWLGIPSHRYSYWDMDHILPVSKGGGECDLDNLRTLCIWCHKRETKKLRSVKKCNEI